MLVHLIQDSIDLSTATKELLCIYRQRLCLSTVCKIPQSTRFKFKSAKSAKWGDRYPILPPVSLASGLSRSCESFLFSLFATKLLFAGGLGLRCWRGASADGLSLGFVGGLGADCSWLRGLFLLEARGRADVALTIVCVYVQWSMVQFYCWRKATSCASLL